MKRRQGAILAAGLGLALSLTACGDDGGGDGGGSGEEAGKVGVILPDTESSVRWENADRPALEAAFEEAGVEYEIQNADGDKERMAQIADQMIASGVTVLAIVNLSNASGAAIHEEANAQGVATLDYDRLTLGGSAEAYISYDNVRVGELQGEGLAECLGEGDKNIVYLNGSPDDSNATSFAEGAHNALDPITSYKVVGEQAVPGWDGGEASTIFEQLYTRNRGDVDGVLAANDTLAASAIGVLEEDGRDGEVPVTGQDATTIGLQNILAGRQCMTVFKSAVQQAGALADAAIALATGEELETTGTVQDTEGDREVPAILLEPASINQDNIGDTIGAVFDDGGVAYGDVCTEQYVDACTEAGITE